MSQRSVITIITVLLTLSLSTIDSVHAQQIAFTWDDLPVHGPLPPGETRLKVATAIIAAMQAARLPPAYGFVNGIRVQEEPETVQVLDAWRAAGLPLANHSWSHMNLNQNSIEAFEADVLGNEAILRKEMGGNDWHWFRYPYLAEGDTPEKHAAVRTFLARHGYKVASVTMSFADYQWNEPYARCVAQKDESAIALLESSYLDAAAAGLDDAHRKSLALFHRDIPYVLLMHVGAFDARMLPRLLEGYRSHGVTFIALEAAEKNPFYRVDTHLTLPPGPNTLEEAMATRHLPPLPKPAGALDVSTLCKQTGSPK